MVMPQCFEKDTLVPIVQKHVVKNELAETIVQQRKPDQELISNVIFSSEVFVCMTLHT